jgi:hypothetical protein
MPTTDLDGSASWAPWLQSLLQNQGASQPYGPGGAPGPYSGGSQGLMPGGALMGYGATTPGQPSMGYPAVGQPAPAPATQPAPWFQFGGFHPENILQRHPPGSASLGRFSPNFPVNSAQLGGDTGGVDLTGSSVTPGAPPTPMGQGGIGSDARFPIAPTPMGQGGIGSDARFPTVAGPLAAPNQPTPATGPVDPSIIARRKMLASPAAPATAAPAQSSNRFTQVARPNAPASGYSSGAPMMTALDLSRLFGRG